jgi:hypothetical protein
MIFYDLLNRKNGVRKALVQTENQKYNTPTTAITDNQINHLENLKSPKVETPVSDAPIVECNQSWDLEKLKDYIKGEDERMYYVTQYMGDYEYRQRDFFYRPKVKKLWEDQAEIKDYQMKHIVDYGIEAGFDFISCWDLKENSNLAEFKEYFEEVEEHFRENAKEGMNLVPTLTLKSKSQELIDKIQYLKNEKDYNMVAIDVRALSGNKESLKQIKKFSQQDEKMLLYATNCERMKSVPTLDGSKVSVRELLPSFGFDIVSYAYYEFIPQDETSDKWLLEDMPVYLDLQDKLVEEEREVKCRNNCCNGATAIQIYYAWEAYNDKLMDKVFEHDVITLENKFKEIRESIDEDKDYLDGKEALKDYAKIKLDVEID